jgi:prepilin-type N-terminal cleavage/methylation domain-containing protein
MKTFGKTRRDPQKGKKEFSTHKGFTLIELMVVIAVVAIITSFALPSYRTILEKRQVTSGAEQLTAFLSSAQFESVKRNEIVGVNYQLNGGNWCFSMAVPDIDSLVPDIDSPSCNCADGTCSPGSELVRDFHAAVLTKPDILVAANLGDDDTVFFDPVRGLVVGAETVEIQLISPDEETYAINVEMSPTGRVKICSDSDRASYSVPGYEECL